MMKIVRAIDNKILGYVQENNSMVRDNLIGQAFFSEDLGTTVYWDFND